MLCSNAWLALSQPGGMIADPENIKVMHRVGISTGRPPLSMHLSPACLVQIMTFMGSHGAKSMHSESAYHGGQVSGEQGTFTPLGCPTSPDSK